jgi:hypothetical protein
MKKSRKSSRKKSAPSDRADVPGESPIPSPSLPVDMNTAETPAVPQKTYRMQLVAGRLDDAIRSEIIGMWVSAGALPIEEAERRSREAVLTLRIQEGPVVGVTTASPVHVHHLGVCWLLRMFLLPEHRGFLGKNGLGLPSRMLGASMTFLAQRSALIQQNRPVGVVMVLENKKLRSPRWKRAFEANGWQFAGATPDGSPALFHPLVYRIPEGTVP